MTIARRDAETLRKIENRLIDAMAGTRGIIDDEREAAQAIMFGYTADDGYRVEGRGFVIRWTPLGGLRRVTSLDGWDYLTAGGAGDHPDALPYEHPVDPAPRPRGPRPPRRQGPSAPPPN